MRHCIKCETRGKKVPEQRLSYESGADIFKRMDQYTLNSCNFQQKGKGKAIPVTVREGP
jgi:hypothetical protein